MKNLKEIDGGGNDDIRAWVEKSRKLEREKEVAKKRVIILIFLLIDDISIIIKVID